MAHLWVQSPPAPPAAIPLVPGSYLLTGDPARPLQPCPPQVPADAKALLLGEPTAGHLVRWLVVCRPGALRVNGETVPLGIRMLADRDELRLGVGFRVHLSLESSPVVEAFPAGGPQPVTCPRCHQPIAPAAPAVRCPGCQAWHHQSPERSCWTYDVKCSLCAQATRLESGLVWSPEPM